MTEKQTFIEFSDFGGGDSGRERPLPNALSKYRGLNTWRYPNGAIGPRPAWAFLAFTGLPTGKTLTHFTTSVGGGGWFAWAFSDKTVYSVIAGQTVAALRGTLGDVPSDSVTVGNYIYYVSNAGTGGGRVGFDGSYASVVTPLADLVVQHGSQTVALRQQDSKLYWSDPDDPTSWPAANAVFVGDQTQATGIYVQRNTVVITKINGEVWVFTGTFGVNEVLRRVDSGLLHPAAGQAKGSIVGNSVLYFTSGSKMTAWTGAELKTIFRPDMPAAAGFNSSPKSDNVGAVVSCGEPNQFLVLGTMDNIAAPTTRRPWFHSFSPEAGWNRHTFPVADYTLPATHLGGFTSADSSRGILTSFHINGAILACRPSDAAGVTTVRNYLFLPRQETPYSAALPLQWGASTAILDGDLTTPVIATFQSAEFWAPEGRDVFVRALIIDYSYDTDAAVVTALGAEVPNKFDLTVEALQRNGGSSASSTSQTVTASGGNSIDGGSMSRTRTTLRVGDQGPGPGFRWKLADWRGIMIHRVIVVADISEARF